MSSRIPEAELLVAGVGLVTVGLVAALAIAGGSGIGSAIGRRRRLAEAAPGRGEVPPERHRHVESAAAR